MTELAIRNRALVVRSRGEYIGLFEWLVWATCEKVGLFMLFGSHVVDLRAFLAPWLCADFPSSCRVAVVKYCEGMPSQAARIDACFTANHYMAGKACLSPPSGHPKGASASSTDAARAALWAGWILVEVDATGDCGIDTMAYCLGAARTPASWLEMRCKLGDFMESIAGDEDWHMIWKNCAENESDALVSSASFGLGPPLAPSQLPPSASLPPLQPPSPTPLQPPPSSPPPLPPPLPSLPSVLAALILPPSVHEGASVAIDGLAPLHDAGEATGGPAPLAPVAVAGSSSFVKYVKGLSLEELGRATSSVTAWKDTEEAILATQLGSVESRPAPPLRRRHHPSALKYRLAIGRRYEVWLGANGKDSKNRLKEFLKQIRVYDGVPPKKDRVWLASCLKAWKKQDSTLHTASRHSRGGHRAVHRTPDALLRRARGTQGAPYKCPELRELLWDWFVDIRRSLATIVTPKLVLAKAKELAHQLLKSMRALGHYSALPKLDRHWLLRWKRDFGVVLRRPNLRFKCSKGVLCARLRAMWLNVIRVRHLAVRLLGKGLDDQMWGIDEKPLHFNEAGSKGVGTLEIQGAPAVRLKENHAATRERVSLMTSVTSNPHAASSPDLLPIELLCRDTKGKRNKKLVFRGGAVGLKLSLAWAVKGSYRHEHIMGYLKRWLDPWTDVRASRKDWRILFMDVAKSHLAPEILALCHERGYVLLLHYGCTTGVAQVNDTDLHQKYEQAYIELEQYSFNIQQMHDPGCISRSLQNVLDDVAGAWRQCDHSAGVRGHKFNGMSVALNGDEDYMISREAGSLWKEMGMPEARLRAIAEVDALIASGEVATFADWQKLIRHPWSPGVQKWEGGELEDPLAPGDCPWVIKEEAAALEKEEAADIARSITEGVTAETGLAPSAGEVAPLVDEAQVTAKRLAALKRIRAESLSLAVPAAVFTFDRQIRMRERAIASGRSSESKVVNAVLRAHLASKEAKAWRQVKKNQAASRRVKKVARLRKEKDRRVDQAKKKATAEKKALAKKINDLPKTFCAKDCGLAGKDGHLARVRCLERLKLRSPKLSFEHEVRWPIVRYTFCRSYKRAKKLWGDVNIGAVFINDINKVLANLVEHFVGATKFNTGGKTGGDPDAFNRFFHEMDTSFPKPATTAVL